MADAPFGFQARHGMVAMLLFAPWPFTRLVPVFSTPVGYLWWPYVVYRVKAPDRLGRCAAGVGARVGGDRPRPLSDYLIPA